VPDTPTARATEKTEFPFGGALLQIGQHLVRWTSPGMVDTQITV
jgi:hypothetical protein